jgi:hypothetical protein
MSLTVAICVAWLAGGPCVVAKSFSIRTDKWVDLPCIELVPTRYRRLVVDCKKTREAAT